MASDSVGFYEVTYWGRVSHNLVPVERALLERLERGVRGRYPDRLAYHVRELCGACRREHDAWARRAQVLERAGRVGIDDVAVRPVDLPDDPLDLRIVAPGGGERVAVKVGEAVDALARDLPHHGPHAAGVAPEAVVEEALEVGGHLDVHRRREARAHWADPVFAGREEPVQDVVAVRGHAEAPDRDPHLLEHPPREDVPEVAGGDHEGGGRPAGLGEPQPGV